MRGLHCLPRSVGVSISSVMVLHGILQVMVESSSSFWLDGAPSGKKVAVFIEKVIESSPDSSFRDSLVIFVALFQDDSNFVRWINLVVV